jgi:hypothetical protein
MSRGTHSLVINHSFTSGPPCTWPCALHVKQLRHAKWISALSCERTRAYPLQDHCQGCCRCVHRHEMTRTENAQVREALNRASKTQACQQGRNSLRRVASPQTATTQAQLRSTAAPPLSTYLVGLSRCRGPDLYQESNAGLWRQGFVWCGAPILSNWTRSFANVYVRTSVYSGNSLLWAQYHHWQENSLLESPCAQYRWQRAWMYPHADKCSDSSQGCSTYMSKHTNATKKTMKPTKRRRVLASRRSRGCYRSCS